MREALVMLAVLGILAAGATLLGFAAWQPLARAGTWMALGGLGASVPPAVVYHLRLHAALSPRRALDRRWIWDPVRHHERLTPAERRRVLPWFYAGAAGWAVSLCGCSLVAVSLLRMG